MKYIFILILVYMTLFVKADYWTQKANFPGIKREFPFSFSIETKGYVGGGMDSLNNLLNDFWEYDSSTDTWTQKANFGGSPRQNASGFSVLNKGYVVFGVDSLGMSFHLANDLWEYDPFVDTWIQKTSFPGLGRQGATAFSTSNKAFVGFGIDWTNSTCYNDLWQYESTLDLWIQKTSMSGQPREGAVGFTIGNKGYVGTGTSSAPTIFLQDFWEYDIASDTWTQKANFMGGTRTQPAGFSIGCQGYLGTGDLLFAWTNDFYQYDPNTNTWIQKTNLTGDARDQTAYFSIGDKGYIGLGSFFSSYFHNLTDFWEYTPDSVCTTSIEEFANSSLQFMTYPNPCTKELTILLKHSHSYSCNKIVLYNSEGNSIKEVNCIFEVNNTLTSFDLNTNDLSSGIYFIRVGNIVSRFIKQ